MKIRFLVQIKGTVYHWSYAGNAFQVGRSMNCALPLTGPDCAVVSAQHARFEFNQQGDLFVVDLGSKNGTYLNSQRLGEPGRLKVGDVISFGERGPKLTVLDIEQPNVPHQPQTPFSTESAATESNLVTPPHENIESPKDPIPFQAPNSALTSDSRAMQKAEVIAVPTQPTPPTSPTRQLLMLVMAGQKRQRWIIIGLTVLVTACLIGFGILFLRPGDTARHNSNPELYNRILRSTVWINMPVKKGTGAIVDKQNRLIVTNYHVVEKNKYVTCVFPEYNSSGLIKKREYYQNRARKIKGEVLETDEKRDLALIQLQQPFPDEMDEFRLVKKTPSTGLPVFLVGAFPQGPGEDMWVYSEGVIQSIVDNTTLKYTSGHTIQGTVILSSIPVNQGNSGSALVNREGILVGVSLGSHLLTGTQSRHIAAAEVRKLLKSAGFEK